MQACLAILLVPHAISPVCRATSLVLLGTLPGLLIRARLLSCTASSLSHLPCASCNLAGSSNPSPSHLARASCNLAGSANPCELTFLHRKFAEPPHSCSLQPCRVCSLVRVYFPAPEVRRATSLVPLATLPGLLTRGSLLSCNASLLSHLPHASCNLAGSANPCALTFLHSKFAEPARSCLLQPCRVCSLVRVYFPAPEVRRATSLVPLATLPGLLTRGSLLSCNASLLSHLPHASCNLAGSANPATSLSSCNFVGTANPCELAVLHRKFAEARRSCFLQPCQVRRATSLGPLATLPGVLTRASLLSCTASSPSHLPRVSCNLAESANPCELTVLHRKFVEPPRSCLLQPCRVWKPQVRRACSHVPLVTLPGLLTLRRATSLVSLATLPDLQTRARLLSCTASSPSLLARASCNLAGSAHPYEFTFLHCKFAEPTRSPLATLLGLLTRASLLSCTASSPRHVAHASSNLAKSAHPCEFTLVRDYFPAPQVRSATSLVPLATLPGLLTRASLPSCTASSPSHLAHASCNLAGSAHSCEFTFLHLKFTEPPRSCLLQPCRCFLQPCRVCSLVRVYFPAPEIRRATSLGPLATLPGLLICARLLSCTASSLSHLPRASCNLAGSANPCELTFLHRKFAEPPNSCFLQPCRVCSLLRVYFPAPEVRRATSLVPLATLPGQLTRQTRARLLSCIASSPSLLALATYNLAGSAHPCEFTFLHRKFAEPPRSPLATLLGLLTRASLLSFTASSPSHLAHASFNLAGSTNPCEFTFLQRKFAEPPPSCLLQPCRVCSPVRVYFLASQVRLAISLVPLANLPDQQTRARLLSCTARSPSLLALASYNLAGSAHPCEFTFLQRKFAEPPPSCLLQPCRICKPVRAYFPAQHGRRACSLLPLTTLPGLLTHPERVYFPASQVRRATSLVPLATLPGSAIPCVLTFLHLKFAEPPRSCFLQPCRVCSLVRVYFPAPEIR
ncbi:hypothetical protein CRG98_008260 [Punica granatum]|uniref:Uncharacterized protein n=1 Tax=Punica granatum TaxID=22663 RepID=A0A2I0KS86_PUNGR|nr:hypothetical protein CRG98_008260 [Punica granatum]